MISPKPSLTYSYNLFIQSTVRKLKIFRLLSKKTKILLLHDTDIFFLGIFAKIKIKQLINYQNTCRSFFSQLTAHLSWVLPETAASFLLKCTFFFLVGVFQPNPAVVHFLRGELEFSCCLLLQHGSGTLETLQITLMKCCLWDRLKERC